MQLFLDALSLQVLSFVQSGQSHIVTHSAATPENAASTASFIEAYPHDRERHTNYEWMWQLSGEARMKINGHIYTLVPGDFCFLPPLVLHADVYDRQTPSYQSIWFGHWPGVLSSTLFSYQQFGCCEIEASASVPAPPMVTTAIAALQSELEQGAAYGNLVNQGLLLQLVALLLRALKASDGLDAAPKNSASARVLFFLREHYAQNLTLADMARHTRLSPNYLAAIFKQETGQTIFDALTKIRIEHATRLLLEDQLPVSEIAKAVGYNSLDRFSRVFRQIKGVPPSLYGQ